MVPMRIKPLNVNASHEPGGGRNPNPAHEPSGSWVQCAKTKGSWRSNLNPNRRRGLRLRLRLRLRLGAEEGYTHSEGRSRGGAYASTLGRLECGPCTEAARAGACSVPRSAWSACASAPLWYGNARKTVSKSGGQAPHSPATAGSALRPLAAAPPRCACAVQSGTVTVSEWDPPQRRREHRGDSAS